MDNKILVKKETAGSTVYDIASAFDVWCQELPFAVGYEVKEPVVRDWRDEDGEDSYTEDGLFVQAYDMVVKWVAKGPSGSVKAKIARFLSYLSGRDGSGVKLSMYSAWTGVGRQHMRLKKVSDTAQLDRCGDFEVVTIETTFRVEDPVTDITLTEE